MKQAFLVLTLAVALSAAAVAANASPASVLNSVNRKGHGGVGQGADLSMVQIQSLASQRQTAIQTTTQMMNGLGCTKCIAKNIGN
jgi:hypothetical protein